MQEKPFPHIRIGLIFVALAIAFLVTLAWVAERVPELRTAHFVFFFLMACGIGVAVEVRADRGLDEVELAASRFGYRWGLLCGVNLLSLLTFLPPVQMLLADTAAALGRIQDKTMTAESRLFLLGIFCTFVAQMTFRSLFSAAWKWSKR